MVAKISSNLRAHSGEQAGWERTETSGGDGAELWQDLGLDAVIF